MGKIILLLLVSILAGCQNTVGPVANFEQNRQRLQQGLQGPDLRLPDGTRLTDEEQERQVREIYPYLEDSRLYAPNSYTDRPGVMGR